MSSVGGHGRIKIYVRFPQRAGDLVPEGKKATVVELPENSTIKDLLEHIRDYISRRIGEGLIEKRLILTVLVNGEAIINLDHVLKDGDTVTYMSPGMPGMSG
ncbi:MAG: MoaD/ThiS family protein [Desulfurococcales archaeon]|nr:MoaD/ThiS family protein [Desulfurococcales archaeon]